MSLFGFVLLKAESHQEPTTLLLSCCPEANTDNFDVKTILKKLFFFFLSLHTLSCYVMSVLTSRSHFAVLSDLLLLPEPPTSWEPPEANVGQAYYSK